MPCRLCWNGLKFAFPNSHELGPVSCGHNLALSSGSFVRRIVGVTDVVAENVATEYVYGGQGGWQILEEHEKDLAAGETAATLARSYVYGNSIDEVLTFRDHDQNEFVDDLFLHGDDMHTVYAVTDEIVDQVLERYE